ncbi:MAG: hypothetical protein FWE74_09150 [Oscillospiraceae bacterium]|nr:hypothetical protein [Oscillospiraceae bacterium]
MRKGYNENMHYYLAADLVAWSGKHLLGWLKGGKLNFLYSRWAVTRSLPRLYLI